MVTSVGGGLASAIKATNPHVPAPSRACRHVGKHVLDTRFIVDGDQVENIQTILADSPLTSVNGAANQVVKDGRKNRRIRQ